MDRNTQTIDATGKTLGRLAIQIAYILRGKNKPSYMPHLDQGDFVVLKNVSRMKISGKKLKQKEYLRHTGYMGHLRKTKMGDLFEKNPAEVVRKAVYGMLPANKLRPKMIKRLKCYA